MSVQSHPTGPSAEPHTRPLAAPLPYIAVVFDGCDAGGVKVEPEVGKLALLRLAGVLDVADVKRRHDAVDGQNDALVALVCGEDGEEVSKESACTKPRTAGLWKQTGHGAGAVFPCQVYQ